MSKRTRGSTKQLKAAIVCGLKPEYVLRMYVCGTLPRSQQAICNVMAICGEQLAGRYDLEVIDISQHPDIAKSEQIFATPVLIRKRPLPERRLIGSMGDKDKVLVGLDLQGKKR